MQRKAVLWIPVVALVALVLACGGDQKPASPTTPSPSVANGASAAADTVTLKVNAPALTSPVGGVRLTDSQVTLTFQAATAKFVTGESFTYRVQLMNASSVVLEEKTGTATSYKMATQFDADTLYRWRVRAEQQGQAGPWSTTESFRSMEKPTAYIKANEIYDPLIDGKTVGLVVGPHTWIPGQGLRLDSEGSYVEYGLTQTVSAGEYSMLVMGLETISSTEDPKWRVMSMREGGGAINDNRFRMTADKRGNGAVAYRFITGNTSAGNYIETGSSERKPYPFHESLTYFYKATWGGGIFRLLVLENGVTGSTVFDSTKSYKYDYVPNPHMVYLGSPFASGDRGEPASCEGMVVRQVWMSPNPRPSWANQ
jgi:hypothetical protein